MNAFYSIQAWQQSPIDIPAIEKTEFEPNFKLKINYNALNDVRVESIKWSVKVRFSY